MNGKYLFSERVTQLERVLLSTQRSAGLPEQLPYNAILSPPEVLNKPLVNKKFCFFCWKLFEPSYSLHIT